MEELPNAQCRVSLIWSWKPANAAMRLTSMSSSRIMLEFEKFGTVGSTVSRLFSNILSGDSEVPLIGDSEHV